MIKHEASVIESFATKLAREPRLAVLLSDVLLHGASLDLHRAQTLTTRGHLLGEPQSRFRFFL